MASGAIASAALSLDNATSIATVSTELSNDEPFVAGSFSTTEDTAFSFTTSELLDGFTDADGDTLSIAGITASWGELDYNADTETYTYTPDSNYNGTDTLDFVVTDSNGGNTMASIDVNITAENDAPTATFATAQATSSAEITGQLTATDVDAGDTLTYSLNNAVLKDATGNVIKDANDNPIAVAGLEINDDGSWSFDPSNDAYNALAKGQTQTITVDYSVTDGSDATGNGSFVISLTGTNDAPVATFSAAQTTTEDAAAPISGQLTATDADSNDTLTYQLLGAPIDGLTINSTTGAWSFDPSNAAYQSLGANDSQTINVAYSVTDTNGAISQNSFNITLSGTNDKPVANAAALVLPSIQEDTTLNFSEAQLLSGVSDVDGDKLSVVANSIQITTGDASVAINPAGGWTITPDANYQGEVSFSYSISDGTAGDEVSSTATFQVFAINDAPIYGKSFAVVTSANEGVQILDVSNPDSPISLGSLADAADINIDNAAAVTTVEIDGNDFAVVASSNEGLQIIDLSNPAAPTAAGSLSDSATINIDNAAALSTAAINGSTYALIASRNEGLQIINISDPAAPTAAGSLSDSATINIDNAAALSTAAINGSTYAALVASSNEGLQIIDISDPAAPTAAGSLSDSEAINIDNAAALSTAAINGSTYALIASSNEGLQIIDISDPAAPTAAGSLSDSATINIDNAAALSTAAINGSTYALIASSNEGLQIIDISDPAAPTAAGSLSDSETLSIDNASSLSTFTANGKTYAAITSSNEGVQLINISDPANPLASGAIADSAALSLDNATSIATVSTELSNDEPFVAGSFSTTEDTAFSFTTSELLDGFTDADGDTLSIAGITASWGELDYNADTETYTYTPDSNYNGTDTLDFVVTDSNGGNTMASIDVNITAENDAPDFLLNDLRLPTIKEEGTLTISSADLLIGATDIDKDNLVIVEGSLAVSEDQGSIEANANNGWTFTPKADFNGPVRADLQGQ